MSDITPSRTNIQTQEVQYASAVSEATFTRIGAAINHINTYQYKHFEFGFMKAISFSGSVGSYNIFTAPKLISDYEEFPTDAEIVGITLIHSVSGSSGTTELDLEWASSNDSTWASIFSTTPKVTSAAPANSQFDTFGAATTPSGCTVPVLSKTTYAAGDVLRCQCVSLQGGQPNGFMMRVYWRPL